MTDTIKQVKVDNWGDFFLRSLQALYTRGDYCDLTLQFHTNECIRVHRLVLKACTEYFENLLKQNNVTDHMRLPPGLNSDVVVPIINFMYSGLLEFRPELITRLYNTAKILKMNILTSLLDTHAGPISSSPLPTPNIEPSVVSMVASPGKNTIKRQPSDTYPLSPQHATAAALMQPLPASANNPPENSSPPKKLSIWKKRTTSVNSSSHTNSFVTVIPHRPVVEEPAKPTRFEWPEEDTDAMPLLYSSTFDDISYDSVPIVKSINNMVKSKVTAPSTGLVVMPQQRVMPVATFESVYQSANLKRPASSPSPSTSTSPTAKKQKVVDMNDVKEYIQEQEVRKGLISHEETETDDLDDFLPQVDNDNYEEEEDDHEGEEGQQAQTSQASTTAASKQGAPKPILKVSEVSSPDVSVNKEPAKTPGSSKKVRFSSENKVHTLNTNAANKPGGVLSPSNSISTPPATPTGSAKPSTPTASQNQQIIVQNAIKSEGTGQQSPKASTNHAKIIAEVLKKYPHLVKHNKNIRLKIMQRDGPGSPSVDQGSEPAARSKVSYMVVKAESCLKPDDNQANESSKTAAPTGAENTKGPWMCVSCGTEGAPIIFPTYYNYIKHLQEVHNEKFDARLCEHCGYKANKRNLLLYHLLTKHNVPPPSNYSFPKCEQCEYYALSELLLQRHRNVHASELPKDVFVCQVCKAGFKTATALNGHIQMKSHWDGANQRAHRCPVCNKSFSSHATMKSHVDTIHKNVAAAVQDELEDDPDEVEHPESSQDFAQTEQQNQQIQVHEEQHETHLVQHQETQMMQQTEHQEQHATYILPDVSLLSGAQQGTLLQSTEAESLSNVASGIAASLGVSDSMVVVEQPQTVLYLDKGQLIQLQTAGGNVHGVPQNTHVQEYIVPEIMASDISQGVGVYTGQLSQIVQYASGGIQTNDQGILTIVNPNGTIVSQAAPMVQQEILQHVPVQQEAGMEGMAVVISDHDYAEEGTVQQNGDGTQTMDNSSAVSQLPIVGSVPAPQETERTTQRSELEIPKLVREIQSEQMHPKMECCDEDSSNPPPVLERESPVPSEPSPRKLDDVQGESSSSHPSMAEPKGTETSEKMAALVRDWDDFDDDNAGQVDVSCQPIVEEALPSRPTILLKSDMDHDDLSDNLVKIT